MSPTRAIRSTHADAYVASPGDTVAGRVLEQHGLVIGNAEDGIVIEGDPAFLHSLAERATQFTLALICDQPARTYTVTGVVVDDEYVVSGVFLGNQRCVDEQPLDGQHVRWCTAVQAADPDQAEQLAIAEMAAEDSDPTVFEAWVRALECAS